MLTNYKEIATINEEHKVYLVKNNHCVYVKKILDVYNTSVYKQLMDHSFIGIPKIIECEEINQQLIVIEEYIQGKTLEETIEEKSLNPSTIQNIMIQLCDILKPLHKANIVHRDIKPSNIILSKNQVYLLDFNAAKHVTHKESDTRLIGTMGYAAPEQFGFGSSNNQTDIYALGILLKEMVDSISSHQYKTIISKCTEINPKDRFEDVEQLKNALLNKSIYFLPPGFRTRTPWKMLIGSIGYLGILAITVLSTNYRQDELLTGFHDFLYKIAIFLIGIILVFVPCNYMNIQKCMPLCKSKNIFIQGIGIILLVLLFLLALVFILSTIESILF